MKTSVLVLRTTYNGTIQENNLLDSTSKEHLTSSTVGHIISGSPGPRGVLSSDKPDDNDEANSDIHFSSKEPREENYNKETKKLQSLDCA